MLAALLALDARQFGQKQIVIDGKKLKCAAPRKQCNHGLYLLNTWVSENGFWVGQRQVEDKDYEKTPDSSENMIMLA